MSPRSRRPGWLERSWWTADRVSRTGSVSVVVWLVLRLGRDDHPAAPAAAWVAFAVSVALCLLATALYVRDRRRRREPGAGDCPAPAGRGGGR